MTANPQEFIRKRLILNILSVDIVAVNKILLRTEKIANKYVRCIKTLLTKNLIAVLIWRKEIAAE